MKNFSDFDGINDLISELSQMMDKTKKTQDILEIGAKEFVKDLLKLPKPISKIRKSGYTHLITVFSYKKLSNGEIEVGWGKYYGRMVEDGTIKANAQPHLKPTFNKNKTKYYSKMINEFYR